MAKRLEIVYQDEHVVAVNKPAGLASIPGRAEATSVLQELGRELELPTSGDADPPLRVVHRLDKDTSGVMLFAKDLPTQRFLSHQFQNNAVEKRYLALVIGRPVTEEGEVDAPIAPDRRMPGKMMVDKRGKPARTLWRVERAYRGLTLVKAFPKTGKTHQIRVHLAYIGHPLAVDNLYGPPAERRDRACSYRGTSEVPILGKARRRPPLIARLTLHAEGLKLKLEDKGEIELNHRDAEGFQKAPSTCSTSTAEVGQVKRVPAGDKGRGVCLPERS